MVRHDIREIAPGLWLALAFTSDDEFGPIVRQASSPTKNVAVEESSRVTIEVVEWRAWVGLVGPLV